MSAYGDLECVYCGAVYYELDAHTCGDDDLKATIATQRKEIERLRKNARTLRQCALPDAYDERGLSAEWLSKKIFELTTTGGE